MSHRVKMFSIYGFCLNDFSDEMTAQLLNLPVEDINKYGLIEFQEEIDELANTLPEYRGNKPLAMQAEDDFIIGYGEISDALREDTCKYFSESYDVTQELKVHLLKFVGNKTPVEIGLHYGIITL